MKFYFKKGKRFLKKSEVNNFENKIEKLRENFEEC